MVVCMRVFDFVYTFPFEGNWNANRSFSVVRTLFTLYIPSRLKGIETIIVCLIIIEVGDDFVYTLPFEGNWNLLLHELCRNQCQIFVYTFPFEGNWNSLYLHWRLLLFPLYIPSRLKGIETIIPPLFVFAVIVNFVYTFPFEGNWNQIWFVGGGG